MDFRQLVEDRLAELGENVNSFEAKNGWRQGFLRTIVRKDEKRTVPNIERAKEICEAMGLEFYIGPPRPMQKASDFAEDAVARIDPSVDGSPEALRMGFLPIPFHQQDKGHRGVGPIALARSWLIEQGLRPDDTYLVSTPNEDMAPTLGSGDLLLVDASKELSPDAELSVFRFNSAIGVGWALAPSKNSAVVFFEGRYTLPVVAKGPQFSDFQYIGQVVARFDDLPRPWISNHERLDLLNRAKALINKV